MTRTSALRRTALASFTAFSLAAAALVATPLSALAATWTVDPAKSSLGFVAEQAAGPITGEFKTWTASIDFDPEKPEAAVISAKVDTGSATMDNEQFTGMLPQTEYFNVSAFPEATFTTTKVTATGGNSYEADGTLTIKGIEQPVSLTFTLEIDGDTAVAKGEATLSRLNYDMGKTVATSTLKDAVKVTLDLTASR